MRQTSQTDRREFLRRGAIAAGAWALAGRDPAAGQPNPENQEGQAIGPAEDLMREHGVLRRILLIYEEGIRRIQQGEILPTGVLNDASDIIRRFINEYHEQLEETYLFPRFERAEREVDLVKVLRRQHRVSQDLTESILQISGAAVFQMPDNRRRLVALLQQFLRMYRPHAAREDTVLFPAFHDLVTCREYRRLGERFEDKEQELFGVAGFERMVGRVAGIEKALGLYDLNQFTPGEAPAEGPPAVCP